MKKYKVLSNNRETAEYFAKEKFLDEKPLLISCEKTGRKVKGDIWKDLICPLELDEWLCEVKVRRI